MMVTFEDFERCYKEYPVDWTSAEEIYELLTRDIKLLIVPDLFDNVDGDDGCEVDFEIPTIGNYLLVAQAYVAQFGMTLERVRSCIGEEQYENAVTVGVKVL